jgi:DNA-binding HxlR family transcriptional regulator
MQTSPVLNSKNCPVTHAIKIMGRRWKPLVLNYLKPGPLRFSEAPPLPLNLSSDLNQHLDLAFNQVV